MSPVHLLAVDPGTTESGFVTLRTTPATGQVELLARGVMANTELLHRLTYDPLFMTPWYLAIEQIRSYGMAIGATTLDTVEWSGRLIQQWLNMTHNSEQNVLRIPRIEIKSHLCHSGRATDANIRQALIDRLGEPGTKKNPGPTYGVTSHIWAALAVAIVAADRIEKGAKGGELDGQEKG